MIYLLYPIISIALFLGLIDRLSTFAWKTNSPLMAALLFLIGMLLAFSVVLSVAYCVQGLPV